MEHTIIRFLVQAAAHLGVSGPALSQIPCADPVLKAGSLRHDAFDEAQMRGVGPSAAPLQRSTSDLGCAACA